MTVPMAAADPQQFPDLRGYNDINSQDYRTYSAYSTIGPQFLTPWLPVPDELCLQSVEIGDAVLGFAARYVAQLRPAELSGSRRRPVR